MRRAQIRLYISSTFEDMHAERDYLVRHVFPALRFWCRRRDAEFASVDLRWGVTEDLTLADLPIALGEIDRARPFFLCLLGDRYGSVVEREVSWAVFEMGDPPPGVLFYLREPGVHSHPRFPPPLVATFAERDERHRADLERLRAAIRTVGGDATVRGYSVSYAGLRIDRAMIPGDLPARDRRILEQGFVAPSQWEELSEPAQRLLTTRGLVALSGVKDLARQVLADLRKAIKSVFESSSSRATTRRRDVADWWRFVRAEAHVLRYHPSTLFQQAANQPESGEPAQAARDRTGVHRPRPWFRLENRPWIIGGLCLSTLEGHRRAILACAAHPSEPLAVTAAEDGTLKLWDAETGAEVTTLQGHRGPVTSCAFSVDGKWLASASGDATVKLWDLDRGSEVRTLVEPSAAVNACAFSPDGRWLVYGCGAPDERGEVGAWNVADWERASCWTAGQRGVAACVFSPDGRRLFAMGFGALLGVWDTRTWTRSAMWDAGALDTPSCAISPDGRTIAVAGSNGTLGIREIATGAQIRAIAVEGGAIGSCAFSPDGKHLVSGTDGLIQVWETASGAERGRLEGHRGKVTACSFFPDGRLLSASVDGTARIWETDKDVLEEFRMGRGLRHDEAVRDCIFLPGGPLISASADGRLLCWDADSGEAVRTLEGHARPVLSCATSPDGRRVASGDSGGTVKVWDGESGLCLHTLSGHRGGITGCQFSPDESRIATSSTDGTLGLWRVETGERQWVLEGHHGSVDACVFTPDGGVVVSASSDGTLKLWIVQSGAELGTLRGHQAAVACCDLSPDGLHILSGSSDQTVRMWEIWSGAPAAEMGGFPAPVRTCGFSPDGARIVAGASDGTIRTWAREAWDGTLDLKGHAGSVNACRFYRDSRWILSASSDGTLRLWDAIRGCLDAFLAVEGEILCIAVAPAGDRLAVGNSHGRVYLIEPMTFSGSDRSLYTEVQVT